MANAERVKTNALQHGYYIYGVYSERDQNYIQTDNTTRIRHLDQGSRCWYFNKPIRRAPAFARIAEMEHTSGNGLFVPPFIA